MNALTILLFILVPMCMLPVNGRPTSEDTQEDKAREMTESESGQDEGDNEGEDEEDEDENETVEDNEEEVEGEGEEQKETQGNGPDEGNEDGSIKEGSKKEEQTDGDDIGTDEKGGSTADNEEAQEQNSENISGAALVQNNESVDENAINTAEQTEETQSNNPDESNDNEAGTSADNEAHEASTTVIKSEEVVPDELTTERLDNKLQNNKEADEVKSVKLDVNQETMDEPDTTTAPKFEAGATEISSTLESHRTSEMPTQLITESSYAKHTNDENHSVTPTSVSTTPEGSTPHSTEHATKDELQRTSGEKAEQPEADTFEFDLPHFNESLHHDLFLNDTEWMKSVSDYAYFTDNPHYDGACAAVADDIFHAFGVNLTANEVRDYLTGLEFLSKDDMDEHDKLDETLLECTKSIIEGRESTESNCRDLTNTIHKMCNETSKCGDDEKVLLERIMKGLKVVIEAGRFEGFFELLQACAIQSSYHWDH